MSAPKKSPKGIFCLEGDWWNDLKHPSSVEPLLAIIDQQFTNKRPHIHRDIGTVGELEYYLEKWVQQKYSDYPILYLGFHGGRGQIHVGDQRLRDSEVSLDHLSKILRGRCIKQIIYFSSCSTLDLNGHRINTFMKETGALAVAGYCRDVGWIQSAAFELLVLSEFQYGTLTIPGAESMKRRILEAASGMARDLEFRMEIRDASWAPPKVRAAGA